MFDPRTSLEEATVVSKCYSSQDSRAQEPADHDQSFHNVIRFEDARRGFEMDNYDVVSHTGSRQDHVSVKHFGVEGQLVFRVAYQVVRPPRFNMDDCDELIPLSFCRDVVDSEVSSSEHLSGFIAAYMALRVSRSVTLTTAGIRKPISCCQVSPKMI